MNEICVLAPATVSNVVCGFDCLGFAISEPFDEITVKKIDAREVRISHRDDFGLPADALRNVAGVSVQALVNAAGLDHGFDVTITKQIKPGSGIGSSSASSCGAVAAANRLIGNRFSELDLVKFAMEGEKLASGSRHADNVAPCIYGGFTLVRSTEPLDVVTLDFPSMWATIIHPQIEIKTAEARAILPETVTLRDAVRNWSNLGAFISALAKGDFDLLARSMRDDIVEPVRKRLIPKFDEVKQGCLDAGAIGGGISGSGPSMFMLSKTYETADKVGSAMADVYATTGIEFHIYKSEILNEGVHFV